MDEAKSLREPSGLSRVEEDEVNLVDYAAVVWRHRWLIGGLCLIALVATLVVSISMPKVYESTATVLAPKEGAGSGLLGGLAAASGLLQQVPGLSMPSLTSNRDMLVSIVKSRTVARAVVERFRLQERYRARYFEDAIKGLQDATDIKVSKEGVISVTVEDIDPQVAAQMANFYVEQLDRLVTQYGTGQAGRERGFVTEQLARAKTDLEAAEEALRRFQERNRAIVLQDQTRVAIEGAARLKGEIMAAEVQRQVMGNFATEANPEMVALRRRIEEMKRQLGQMQYGDGSRIQAPAPGRDQRDFTVPFPKVPEVGLELARLTRDVKVQETLVTLLTQQVEQARMAEARDLPQVQVLDRAVPAERHSKPRLRLNLALAGVTSLFAGIFLAFFLEYLRNLPRRARAA
jgi:tyrosine-protein kinase Etk/Wzc